MPRTIIDTTSDSENIWYRSEEYKFLDMMAHGEISSTGQRIYPPKKTRQMDIYTIKEKDTSNLTERERAGLGLRHFVEERQGGVKMYSGLKIHPHRWEPDFYKFHPDIYIREGTFIALTPEGRCKLLELDVPKHFKSRQSFVESLYMKIWSNKISGDT